MAVEVQNIFESSLAAKDQFIGAIGFNAWELILFTFGIVLYALFIWHFYRFIGRRDVFKWDTHKYETSGAFGKLGRGFLYFLQYLIIYPIIVFGWFVIFASFMFVLGENVVESNILLVSFAIVTAIRITAYYKEGLSLDLAKLIPLALLVVYIVQPNIFEFQQTSDRLIGLGEFLTDIVKFIAFSVVIEWILRMLWSIKQKIAPNVHIKDEVEGVRKTVERFGR